jgi:hypothetical protein
MERVGYDEETSTYTYLDRTDGTYWEGEEGNEYGELHRQGQSRPSGRGYHPSASDVNAESWRYFLPFALIVCAVLGTLFWYVGGGGKVIECQDGWERYMFSNGDTCWGIAEGRGTRVEDLVKGNEGLVCEELRTGQHICAPVGRQG